MEPETLDISRLREKQAISLKAHLQVDHGALGIQ
jgi:hypothetical protein